MTTKQLKLDRDHIIAMARSPAFFDAVPGFEYLREVSLTSYKMYKESVECKECGADWKYMKGVVDAIVLKLREWQVTRSPELENVRKFLSSKKGYICSPIVLYYRRSRKQGKIAKFTF